MSTLILGSGMIAQAVGRTLKVRGEEVILTSTGSGHLGRYIDIRKEFDVEPFKVSDYTATLMQMEIMLEKHKPVAIINAISGHDTSTDHAGTYNSIVTDLFPVLAMMELCKGMKVIQLGSTEMWGAPRNEKITASSPRMATNNYGIAKEAAESVLLMNWLKGADVTHLALPYVYPRTHGALWDKLTMILEGERNSIDFHDISDTIPVAHLRFVAEIIADAIDQEAQNSLIVQDNLSLRNIVRDVVKFTGGYERIQSHDGVVEFCNKSGVTIATGNDRSNGRSNVFEVTANKKSNVKYPSFVEELIESWRATQ